MVPAKTRSASLNWRGFVWMVAVGLLFTGCATAGTGDTAAPTVDVSGTWNGSFVGVGSTGSSFTFVAVLEQKGNAVTGTISGGGAATEGAIRGTVSGNKFSWQRVIGAASGDLVVSGNEMNGTGTSGGSGYPGRLTLRRTQ